MGTVHEEIEPPGDFGPVRSFRGKGYVEVGRGLLVLRVAHGRRDFPAFFEG